MKSLREVVGASPVRNADGTYWPSKASMKIVVPTSTDYTDVDYPNAVTGQGQRILILCTDEDRLTCENGLVFRTGNHPTEIFTVVRHLEKAGFELDFATPTGKPVQVEMFAVPTDDDLTTSEMERHRAQLDHPLQMSAVLATLSEDSPYVAVFVPGGHGALLSVPFSDDAGGILRWFLEADRFVITICHGPAGLLSMAGKDTTADDFPLSGYTLVLFPSADDSLLAAAGYLPGKPTWSFEDRLKDLGVHPANHLPTGSTHVDRKLVSGDSPLAANKLGQLAAHTLLDALNPASSRAD